MRKMAGFGIIAIAVVWGLILMLLWSDSFISDTVKHTEGNYVTEGEGHTKLY